MEFRNDIALERASRDFYEVSTGQTNWSDLRPAQRAAVRQTVRMKATELDERITHEIQRQL